MTQQVSMNGGSEPHWSASGQELFYCDERGILRSAKLQLGASIKVLARDSLFPISPYTGGLRPSYRVHPDGKRVFVSNGGDASVSVIDVASNTITATIGVGQRPWNMALTPDGKKLYVACGRSGVVSVIDTESNTKLSDIAVGKLPWGVVIR